MDKSLWWGTVFQISINNILFHFPWNFYDNFRHNLTSVNWVTGLDDRGKLVRFPTRARGLSLFQNVLTATGANRALPPILCPPGTFFARVKRLGCEAFRPPQSRSEMKNECCNSPTPPYAFMTRKRTNLLLPFRNFQKMKYEKTNIAINPSNAELNAIFHLLALLGARPILHVSSIGVNLSSEGRSSIRTSQWNRLLFFTYKKWLILFRK